MTSRILVLGRSGQIASAVASSHLQGDVEIVCLSREEADLSRPNHAAEAVRRAEPTLVINAAAYTAVDKAESEEETAFRINAAACGEIAESCQQLAVPLLHISTDYVFNGQKTEPYTENDTPNPINVYGASKLAGENLVREKCSRSTILRISWVYSETGSNFVRTMLRLGCERDHLRIVSDQIGTPNYAADVAEALLIMARREIDDKCFDGDVFHMASTPLTNWCEFAREIMNQGVERGLTGNPQVDGISSTDYPTAAQRPSNSALNSDKLRDAFGIRSKNWRQSLAQCLDRLEDSQ